MLLCLSESIRLNEKHDVLSVSQWCLLDEGVAGLVVLNNAESCHLVFKHRPKKEEFLTIKTPMFKFSTQFDKRLVLTQIILINTLFFLHNSISSKHP